MQHHSWRFCSTMTMEPYLEESWVVKRENDDNWKIQYCTVLKYKGGTSCRVPMVMPAIMHCYKFMSISVHRTHNFLPSLDTGYEEKFHKMCSAGKIQLRRRYLLSHKQHKEKGRRVSALPVCRCSSRKRAKQLHWLTSSSKHCSTAQGNLSGGTTCKKGQVSPQFAKNTTGPQNKRHWIQHPNCKGSSSPHRQYTYMYHWQIE